jgi:hypothetical protein
MSQLPPEERNRIVDLAVKNFAKLNQKVETPESRLFDRLNSVSQKVEDFLRSHLIKDGYVNDTKFMSLAAECFEHELHNHNFTNDEIRFLFCAMAGASAIERVR